MRFAPQHLLSLSRLLLGGYVFHELRIDNESLTVLPSVALACGADYADGIVARRSGTETSAGRLLDNLCDAGFLALAFAGFAQAKAWSLPLVGSAARQWEHANWLPLIGLALSFGTYMLRWLAAALHGATPGRSARGHHAGIANYVLAIVGAVAVIPGLYLTPWLLEPAFVTVTLLNFGAAADNVKLLVLGQSDAPRTA